MADAVPVKLSDEAIAALTQGIVKGLGGGVVQGVTSAALAPLSGLMKIFPETARELRAGFAAFAGAAKPLTDSFKGGVGMWDKLGSALAEYGKGGAKGLGSMLGNIPGLGIAGRAGAAALGAAAVPVAAVAGLATVVWGANKALTAMTSSAIESARSMASISPAMAAAFASRDIQEQQRMLRMGQAQAASTRDLIEAEQRSKKQSEFFQNIWANTKNRFLAGFNQAKGAVLEGAENQLRVLLPDWLQKKLDDIAGKMDAQPESMLDWLSRAGKEAHEWRVQHDPRKHQLKFE